MCPGEPSRLTFSAQRLDHIFEVLRDRDALIGRRVVSDVEDVREHIVLWVVVDDIYAPRAVVVKGSEFGHIVGHPILRCIVPTEGTEAT